MPPWAVPAAPQPALGHLWEVLGTKHEGKKVNTEPSSHGISLWNAASSVL